MRRSKEEILNRFTRLLESLGWVMVGECRTILDSVEVVCPNQHTVRKTPRTSIHQNKIECRECQKVAMKARDSVAFMARLESIGWNCLEPYRGSLTKIRVACSNGHEQIKSPNQLTRFQACKECDKINHPKQRQESQT